MKLRVSSRIFVPPCVVAVFAIFMGTALGGSDPVQVSGPSPCSITSTASIALGGSSNDNNIHHNVATTISSFGTGNQIHHNTTRLAIVDNSNGGNSLHDNTIDPSVCF